MKKVITIYAIQIIIHALALTGWIKCAYKFAKCDFSPVGKAEILYGIGTFTGAGAVIGWFDINDSE